MTISKEQAAALIEALQHISHGDHMRGPMGLEALAQAICGENDSHTLAGTVANAADTIESGLCDVAKAIDGLAAATRVQAEAHQKIAGWLPALVAVLNPASKPSKI